MIEATTKVYAVIGDPIAHSLSPVMQNWFICQFGLDAVYTAFHVRNEDLAACIDGMKALGIGGLNVTVPHKEAALPLVDVCSEEVRLLGAANTLKNDRGRITAFVTDPYGFMESLGDNKERFAGAAVLIFGAGGAARSVCYALGQLGVRQVIMHDVEQQKCETLVSLCRSRFKISDAATLSSLNLKLNEVLAAMPIVINATAVGMHPYENHSVVEDMSAVGSNHFFYDLVYNPGATRFLRLAQNAGAAVQSGLDMLIFQGLQSLRIWTGQNLELTAAQLGQLQTLLLQKLNSHG
jgi:shikimate dehydrogenase